jgi:hypothetical protein
VKTKTIAMAIFFTKVYKIVLCLTVFVCGITNVWGFHATDSLVTNKEPKDILLQPFTDGLLPSNSSADPVDSVKYWIDKAQSVMSKVRETQNYITSLNDVSMFQLPVGIPKLINGLNYDIAIYAIRLMPTHAEVDVLMQFEMPQNGKILTFKAKGIKFTKAGGIVGDATLALVGDYGINFSGDKVQLILHGGLNGDKTFATMDCDGFKGMGLDAEVKFSRDVLLPEDASGNVTPGNVSATFSASLNNWNDLIVQLNVPSFQVASMPGMGFAVRDAVFDFSDFRNAPNVKFPEGYNPDFADPSLANLWRGVYLRELSVQLPPEFKSKGTTARTGFVGYDLLIDNQGFTGTIIGTNVLPLNNGDMNGWAFSVDSLGVAFQKSQLMQAGFEGDIIVSVSDEQTPLDYTAVINTGGNYLFNVSPANNLTFNIWGGSKVDIYQASYLEVKIQDKKFLPKAVLHGKLDIKARLSEKGQGIDLANISFENLEIQSVKPYIKIGAFSFGSEALQQKMAGFPISIQNIGMRNISDGEVGLDFNLLLNLTGESGGAFAADAGLTIIGSLKSESGRQRWRYKDTEVRSIKVDISGGAFKIMGSLTFYRNDLTYGDGFNGVVKAEFVPNIKVSATAIFGSVSGERYWYADAMATFTPGILVFPGVAFYGFGGGIYYKMKMDTKGQGSDLGKTASGVVYVPDMNSGLGIKAILNIGSAPTDQAFNGDITFEVAFFRGGGIRTISLTGNAFIATPKLDGQLGKLAEKAAKMADKFEALEAKANSATMGMAAKINDQESMISSIHGDLKSAGSRGAISARAFILYDFENRELHGNFNVGINVAGGILEGKGDAVLHFAPHEWYVYVGTPDQRVYLSIGVGPVRATATSYFMVGSKILGSPPPPPEVSKILGGMDLDYMKDMNAIGTGAGIAFGSSLEIKTGDLTFLMFYASFHAGLGFDIMIKNYGNAYCEGSNERIGINGWYANGQMYAFFMGKVGIKVKVFRIKKKFEILSIGAAAVLQTKLPNPFWMRGVVGGYYSLLGGAVKGNCKFEVVLGEECKIIKKSEGSVLDDIKVISQLTPTSGEMDVNVFNTPQVVFNMPVNKIFTMMENDVTKSFRIKLDSYKLMTENKIEIVGTMQWNESQDVLAFNSFEVLPSKQKITARVQISFEEMKGGSWVRVLENGQPITEQSEVTFTTGLAPDYIPLSNVKYSYPVIGQLNFYKDETTEGYIQLERGQSYLFEPDNDWIQVGRFTDNAGAKTHYDFNHSSGVISFNIPSGNLKTGQLYAFELYKVPKAKAGSIDRNVTEKTTKVEVDGETLDTEIKSKTAEGSIEDLQEKAIFTGYIRSSKYSTLSQKISAINLSTTLKGLRVFWGVDYLKNDYVIDEPFDKVELEGSRYTGNKPLVRLQANLSDNAFYRDHVYPLVYEGYPLDGDITITNRNTTELGIPPVRAVQIYQTPNNFEVNQSDQTYSLPGTSQFFLYDVGYYYYYDFVEIQNKVVQRYLSKNVSRPRTEKIIWGQYPMLKRGSYKFGVYYYLPGKENPTPSAKEIILENNTD